MQKTDRTFIRVLLANIHPDPTQPRLYPDAELEGSIRANGILVPFSVEAAQPIEDICPHCEMHFADLATTGTDYMIRNGERRWRGAIAAGLTHADVELVPALEPGERLLQQVVTNDGKPLTPMEEALAFRSLMQMNDWSQTELAKRLGKPRSLVGDRIRLVELDDAWLELIGKGILRTSHAATLSIFAPVPAEYQKKAAANLVEDYRAKRYIDEGDAIPVDEFRSLVYVAFRNYIKPLSDVRGYKGPTFSFKANSYNGETKYAADIALWRPIHNANEAKRRKEQRQNGTTTRAQVDSEKKQREAMSAIASVDGVGKRATKDFYPESKKGETEVYSLHGWRGHFDAKVLLEHVDPTKLVVCEAQHGTTVFTTDRDALKKAADAFQAAYVDALIDKFKPQRKALREAIGTGDYVVAGKGARSLLKFAARTGLVVAAALGYQVRVIEAQHREFFLDVDSLDDAGVEEVLAGLGAFAALDTVKLEVPWQLLDNVLAKVTKGVELKLPKAAPAAVRRAASKAAGKEKGKAIATARKHNPADFADLAEAVGGQPGMAAALAADADKLEQLQATA